MWLKIRLRLPNAKSGRSAFRTSSGKVASQSSTPALVRVTRP